MTNNIIHQIIDAEYQRALDNSNPYMQNGAMGVALFMILYGRMHEIQLYIDKGIELINEKCCNHSDSHPLDFHNGQVGIGMGLILLYKLGYIENDIERVLSKMDDNIFRQITNRKDLDSKHIDPLIDIGIYLSLRLKYNTFSGYNKRIFSKALSNIINIIYPKHISFICEEPFAGSYSYKLPRLIILLALSMGNGFDNRIRQISLELKHIILSTYPYMSANRLALAIAINYSAGILYLDNRWKNHSSLLTSNIDSKTIQSEYKTKQWSIYNGLAWYGMLIYFNDNNCSDLHIVKNMLEHSVNRQINSNSDCTHGLYGILGAILSLSYLRTKS